MVRDIYFKQWQSQDFKNGKLLIPSWRQMNSDTIQLKSIFLQINVIWPEQRKTIVCMTLYIHLN